MASQVAESSRSMQLPCAAPSAAYTPILVNMSEELILLVFGYLTPASILTTMQLSKEWRDICRSDRLWLPLVRRRWQLPPRMIKLHRYGVHSYLGLYRHLQISEQKPYGLYSTADKPTWGHSYNGGVETWLTLGHRADCKTLPIGAKTYVQLRVVIQNLSSSHVHIDAAAIQVHYKDGSKRSAVARHPMAHAMLRMEPRVLASNGVASALEASMVEGRAVLRFMDYCVVGLYVECDDGCVFESDFLEHAFAVWVPMKRRGHCNDLSRCRCALIPDHYHHFGSILSIVDESIIWSRYSEFAGGFMVLNCKDRRHVGAAGHGSPLPTRYLL
ncbi:hypothetical protein SPRG_10685 [Saprolegnia parasitica CBS 223.65]|uniref:F-box domain-containing protein n=1 Tax=Saprolegnia parasitica (strain CBS 223.65) TaxID=695850 RepID=A0A067C0C1_SAPPC|nr:hypothetical protein SPRG_10685 [Saprolegnia parasitica CBS 223.65]KDO23988.1 hypothetical protein SPRG_10685 [Saprolegnia parasitica CBS 223.65]|eukprot:XP_012205309.1 hypothetical protein SPRG_10685 [Saprolegnia parasitica CBS 223.65]